MVAINLNTTLAESEGDYRKEGILHAWSREGGEVPDGISEVVGTGGH